MKTLLGLLAALVFVGCASVEPKYRDSSTAELKLRHAQCVEFLETKRGAVDIKVGPPLAMMMMGDGGVSDRRKEKEEIESELLRRYQAGDSEAYLPIFGAHPEPRF